jgi:hypothetical protein
MALDDRPEKKHKNLTFTSEESLNEDRLLEALMNLVSMWHFKSVQNFTVGTNVGNGKNVSD